MTQRNTRELDGHEIRVLGCLLEKQQATPDYYPLTLNALIAACNQRSNRNPVLNLSERDVAQALGRLANERLVTRDDSGRATRWRQHADRRWGLDPAGKAVLTVLLLRGPQTAGEVRARTARLHEFASTSEAEAALADLAAPPDPLGSLLERDPGQKEQRWGHRVGMDEAAEAGQAVVNALAPDTPVPDTPAPDTPAPAVRRFDSELVLRRLERLEQQVEEIQSTLRHKPGLFD